MTIYKQKIITGDGIKHLCENPSRRFTRTEITESTAGYDTVELTIDDAGTKEIFYKIPISKTNFAYCKIGDYILKEVDNETQEWGCKAADFDLKFEEVVE